VFPKSKSSKLLSFIGGTSLRLLRDLDRFSEDLAIKTDYTSPKIKPETEIVVLSRFGIVQSGVANTLEFLFS